MYLKNALSCINFNILFRVDELTKQYSSLEDEFRQALQIESSRFQQVRFEKKCHLYFEGWAQDCSNSNIFLKPLFRGNFDLFENNANLGAIAHTSNGT